ncbi:MAG: [protein-PII] uridylyltransferase [Actinomycetales bacterium]|nr:[protein-PII] uridylyltransferase [Actinomycetales bacterium]
MGAALTGAPDPPLDLPALRTEIAQRGDLSAQGRSALLVDAYDTWLTGLLHRARQPAGVVGSRAGPGPAGALGLALVAVGGLGRREVSLGSDVDLLLLHDPRLAGGEVAALADRLWYPIWDSGLSLDHAVRTPAQCRSVAAEDVAVLLGLLDARVIAGDAELLTKTRAGVLDDWRAAARRRLPLLRAAVDQRRATHGEAAHLLEPHLKDSYGGLREATIARALAATWLIDVPRDRLAQATAGLLEVRDGLHRVLFDTRGAIGLRQPDLLRRQEQSAVAAVLGWPDAGALLRRTSEHARAIAHLSDVLWHGIGARLRDQPSRSAVSGLRRRRWRPGAGGVADPGMPAAGEVPRVPLADGVVTEAGEVVLAREADPAADPVLVWRAAAAAAHAGLLLSPATLDRLARAPRPNPWPTGAQDSFIALLGAGPGLLPVWESLDEQGIIEAWLPQWAAVRFLPQDSPIHRWTVDRHLVETCVQASALTRSVRRPDLLLLASLLHDIGKGRPEDHSVLGARIAAAAATRIGLGADDAACLRTLVAHHLLLIDTATRRDLDDPVVLDRVAGCVGDTGTLELLVALTTADACATGTGVWNDWKAGLVRGLARRVAARLGGEPVPAEMVLTDAQRTLAAGSGAHVDITPTGSGTARVLVVHDDRQGLLATLAGTLALHRMSIRQARTLSLGEAMAGRAVLLCEAAAEFGDLPDPAHLAADLRGALAGTLDIAGALSRRTRSRPAGAPAQVAPQPHASARATVVEVRCHDEPALLYRLAVALNAAGADITGAHVQTLGAEAVDTFYLVDPAAGGPLSPTALTGVVAALDAVLAAPGHPATPPGAG